MVMKRCDDGGKCHHDCEGGCWRREHAAPLSPYKSWDDVEPPKFEPVKVEGLTPDTQYHFRIVERERHPGKQLTFDALRQANMARLPHFKNKHGEPAHSEPDGSDWSPAQWLQAVLGELGEYANLRKKYERGDIDDEEFQREAADELADVQCYLDILAFRLGIDLGAATADKWNRISERVGYAGRLHTPEVLATLTCDCGVVHKTERCRRNHD